MTTLRLLALTALTMVAFAANSLLCREALASDSIGAASFTLIRIASGALMLALLTLKHIHPRRLQGSWWSAFALYAYAALFSFAYHNLSTATGALLLFGAVQITMISYGLARGERISGKQQAGVLIAVAGLIWLLLPGVTAPSPKGAALMLAAGVAWGVYSILGRGAGLATQATAGNFIRAVPMAFLVYLFFAGAEQTSATGVVYAMTSGALASGLGYALWYYVLPSLKASTAATVQLSVPVIAAFGGFLFLGENVDSRLVLSSIAVLGGIALFVTSKREAR